MEMYTKLESLESAINLSSAFVSFVHELLDEKDKVIYVTEFNPYNSMKTIEEEILALGPCCVQSK